MASSISLAVTPGEPAGIGPDLLLQLIQEPVRCELVAYADPHLLETRAESLGLPLKLREPNGQPLSRGELAIRPIALPGAVEPGTLNKFNAGYVLDTLKTACDHCLENLCHGLVTGPVNKAIINEAGIPFSGHTEFLAERTGVSRVVMMLATEQLKVALATTHLPLRNVPDALTTSMLGEVIEILNRELKLRFSLQSPRILVCGLNPHAGEQGHMGTEEIDTIIPVLERLRASGIDAKGPYPADTVFTPNVLSQGDAVLAMYHDQGLPVLKYQGFGSAVNITLGLPIIRTSVDHGTALELAGTGRGDSGSFRSAIDRALEMVKSQNLL